MFLDEALIRVRSGDGGRGCVSFRREKYVPRGGPDGGDGGRGGHLWLRARPGIATLLDIGRRRFWKAGNGRPGMGNNRRGRQGQDLAIDVPVGTTVREVVEGSPPREGRLLGDLVEPGARLLVAPGGSGGRGNRAFATSVQQVPRRAQPGRPGQERDLYLELKLLADVGLVGLPNAGKSTLLSRVSAATPKIADYPFTTLEPNLGIVELGDYSRLVFADIPGLIEGAHQGQGLGIEFLRHIERTRVLAHLLALDGGDASALERDYRTVESELESYSSALASKPRLVVLSKADIAPRPESDAFRSELARRLGTEILCLSAVTGHGVEPFLRKVRERVEEARREAE